MAKKEEVKRLFEADPTKVDKDALIFIEPEKKKWDDACSQLNNGLTKNQVWNICQALHPLLQASSTVLVKTHMNGQKRPATELKGLFSQNTNKLDQCRGLALILCEPENLKHYVNRLNAYQRELWLVLLEQLYITEQEAKKILHTDTLIVKDKHSRFLYSEELSPAELLFLKIERLLSLTIRRYGYRQYESFLTIPAAIYSFMFHAFFPEKDNEAWFAYEQLPSDDYNIKNFEVDSVAKFTLLQGLLKADKLPLKSKGISLGDIKRVAKSLGLEEIFSGDGVKGSLQEVMRSRFYIELLALEHHLLNRYDSKLNSIEFTLRRMFFMQFGRLHHYMLSILLPHVKGLRRQLVEICSIGRFLDGYLSLLRNHPKKWIGISQALQQSMMMQVDDESYIPYDALLFSPSNQSDNCILLNEFSMVEISVDSFVKEFGLTVLKAFSLLLCSLGMAEVALSSQKRRESPFACADFIRLTSLGEYALNIIQIYNPPKIEQTAFFELDAERLIIRSLANPNPYEQLLRDSSVAISKNRYETSASSFLAGCKTKDDVEKNIAIFRQFISSELPPLWKQFFGTLLNRCHPLKKDTTQYCHYTISPNDTELIKLITTDEKLSQLVVRAEGYLILVKNEDLHKFEERLKKHGYLL